jgi:hypothetical protein
MVHAWVPEVKGFVEGRRGESGHGVFSIKRGSGHRVVTTLSPCRPVVHTPHRVVLKFVLFRPRAHIGEYSELRNYNNCQPIPAHTRLLAKKTLEMQNFQNTL